MVLEDLDAMVTEKVRSFFLNEIDGLAANDGILTIATTNHPERLDPALIRPGRVDLSVLIDDASPTQAKRLFEQFYGYEDGAEGWENLSNNELERFGARVEGLVANEMEKGKRASMAALQGLFIRSNAREAVDNLTSVCK